MNQQCLCLKRAAEVVFSAKCGRDRHDALLLSQLQERVEALPCGCQSAKIEGSERHADAMADAIKRSDFFSSHVTVADYEKWKEEK